MIFIQIGICMTILLVGSAYAVPIADTNLNNYEKYPSGFTTYNGDINGKILTENGRYRNEKQEYLSYGRAGLQGHVEYGYNHGRYGHDGYVEYGHDGYGDGYGHYDHDCHYHEHNKHHYNHHHHHHHRG